MSSIGPLATYSLDELAEKNDKYPNAIVSLHQILRDVCGKPDLADLVVVDGAVFGMETYFLQGILSNGNKRLLLPLAFDGVVDIVWLTKFAKECKLNSTEIHLCIYASDSIIYQLVIPELP